MSIFQTVIEPVLIPLVSPKLLPRKFETDALYKLRAYLGYHFVVINLKITQDEDGVTWASMYDFGIPKTRARRFGSGDSSYFHSQLKREVHVEYIIKPSDLALSIKNYKAKLKRNQASKKAFKKKSANVKLYPCMLEANRYNKLAELANNVVLATKEFETFKETFKKATRK